MNFPSSFEELGMTFIKDEDCSVCETGECHNRATGKVNGVEYYIEVIVHQDFCSETCDNPIFKIDVTMDTSTFAGNEYNRSFMNEAEAVKYLLSTFNDFKCAKY